jgi:hypothetical protein
MKMLVYFTEHFTAILFIFWPFGTFRGQFVYFPRFGMLCLEESGNPALI